MHIRNEQVQKNLLGGILTIAVKCYLLFVFASLGERVVFKLNPDVKQIMEPLDYNGSGNVSLGDMSVTILEITQNKMENIGLEQDYRPFLKITLDNIIKTYPNGEE